MKKIVQILLLLVFLSSFIFAAVRMKPITDPYVCVGCGDCVKICPVSAITLVDGKSVIDQEMCIDCKFCIKGCTYNAIREKK
jgi:sulfite reductase (coenzyme F420)